MAITNDLGNSIIKTYVAAFMRAPDKGGYEYWLNDATANGLSATLGTIFSLDVVKAIYPAAMSSAQFVTAIYSNVFNKAPDTEGLNYWKNYLDQGTFNRGELVLLMINTGLGTPEGTSGRDVILNKVMYATSATDLQLTNGVDLYLNQGVASMQSTMSGVTGDSATIESALAATASQTFTSPYSMDLTSSSYTGGAAAEKIDGLAGNDTIDAGAGNDYVLGGTGNDSLIGSYGSDLIDGGAGDDHLVGGSNYYYYWETDSDLSGNDTLIGGVGNDALYGGQADDYLLGGGNDDSLDGDAGNDTLDGGTGIDSLAGGDGNDSLVGGVGGDVLHGGTGSDILLGGDGNDTIDADQSSTEVIDRNDYVDGGAGNDAIFSTAGVDTLLGGAGDDFISGSHYDANAGAIIADGGAGNDTINGDYNADTIVGGEGLDTLTGGAGNDSITGGEGADSITGGSGDDLIVLTELTQVLDKVKYANKADFGETGDTIVGFTSADVVQFSPYYLINVLGASTSSYVYNAVATQQVQSTATAFTTGISVIVIQGALAAADTSAAAAAFIDAYGNNQTYGISDKLMFVIGVGSNTSVYYYQDDAAGDNRVTTDELSHVVTLTGTSIASLSASNFVTI